jgi:coenzyme F420-reducing hydrogenase alpha subunit
LRRDEDALAFEVSPRVAALRRLIYCGEWIESHTLHMFFLHAPDFLGYPDATAMAREHRAMVLHALAIKKAGNALIRVVGGREIHPVNPRVGGFDAKIVRPTSQNLRSIEDDLTHLAPRMIAMTQIEATKLAEQTVRNYDPCIFCATHFLKVTLEAE